VSKLPGAKMVNNVRCANSIASNAGLSIMSINIFLWM